MVSGSKSRSLVRNQIKISGSKSRVLSPQNAILGPLGDIPGLFHHVHLGSFVDEVHPMTGAVFAGDWDTLAGRYDGRSTAILLEFRGGGGVCTLSNCAKRFRHREL